MGANKQRPGDVCFLAPEGHTHLVPNPNPVENGAIVVTT